MTALPQDVPDETLSGRTVFPALDTLRIIGALLVLTTHAAFWAGAYTDRGVWGTILARLDVGVAIFFVLSGFLLSRPWFVAAVTRQPPPDRRRYFLRRVLRIVPIYVLTAVIALVFVEKNRGLSVVDWLVTLTLTDIYANDGPPHGLTHTWSLATEVSFYIVLPWLVVAFLGRAPRLSGRRIAACLAVGAAVNALWLLYAHQLTGIDSDVPLNQWLPGMFGWFAIGLGLAYVDVAWRSTPGPGRCVRGLRALGRQPGVCWVSAGALLLVAATPIAGPILLQAPASGEALTKHILYAVIGGLLVLPGIFADRNTVFMRLMAHPRLRHLGHISYGVFCLHVLVLHLILWATPIDLFQGDLLVLWTTATVATLLVSDVTYRLIERPAMRLGRRPRDPDKPTVTATETSIR